MAFSGGIDLCYGRYDDESHRLVDLGAQQNEFDLSPDQNLANNSEKIFNSFDAGLKYAIKSLTTNTITILNRMENQPPNATTATTSKMSDITDQSNRSRTRIKKSILKKFDRLKLSPVRSLYLNLRPTSSHFYFYLL